MKQLSFQFADGMEKLTDYFGKVTGSPVCVTLTDNSTSLLSVKTKGSVIAVRMHRMFLKADDKVISEVAEFIQKRKGRMPLIRKFISEYREFLRTNGQTAKQPVLKTVGRFFNLKKIFNELNVEYFNDAASALIGWGKSNSRKRVMKRTLGSYCRSENMIRINPVLDRRNVPLYFIRFVVYHEMLHAVMKEERKNGRRSVHNSAFRKQEHMFREYEKARTWEKKNI